MFKTALTAATLAMLLAGPAFADDDDHRGRGDDRDDRYDRRHDRRDDRRDDWRDHRRDGRYWHDDVRRYYRGRHDDRSWNRYRHWRHVPPARYGLSLGYRSGYELAWDDWRRHGRHDRRWRRHSFRSDFGFRAGYEAGWRDAVIYFSDGYGPRYWARDPRGSWYFGFHIDG